MKARTVVVLALAIAGGLVATAGLLRPTAPASASPVPFAPSLAPFLAPFLALEEGARTDYELTHGTRTSLVYQRFAGWFRVNGAAHARVETRAVRRDLLVQVEWLTPGIGPKGEAQVLCSRRELAGRVLDLVPPQPVLQGNLALGDVWSWSGTAGALRCSATFRVVRREVGGTGREVVAIEQQTLVEGSPPMSNARVQTFEAGRGLTLETGTHPAHRGSQQELRGVLAPDDDAR
jgi:hypothetical protein